MQNTLNDLEPTQVMYWLQPEYNSWCIISSTVIRDTPTDDQLEGAGLVVIVNSP